MHVVKLKPKDSDCGEHIVGSRFSQRLSAFLNLDPYFHLMALNFAHETFYFTPHMYPIFLPLPLLTHETLIKKSLAPKKITESVTNLRDHCGSKQDWKLN